MTIKADENDKVIINVSETGPNSKMILSDSLNLGGDWETPFQRVTLRQGGPDAYEGAWGVNTLQFEVRGMRIVNAHLGCIDLLFGGDVSQDCSTIEWGNGQMWVRV